MAEGSLLSGIGSQERGEVLKPVDGARHETGGVLFSGVLARGAGGVIADDLRARSIRPSLEGS